MVYLRGFSSLYGSPLSQPLDLNQLAQKIKQWGLELGFQQVGMTQSDFSASPSPELQAWLDKQYHGEMDGWHVTGTPRARPQDLVIAR
ncbi:hypothetical protein ACNKHW_27225 [Shigella flexneri]